MGHNEISMTKPQKNELNPNKPKEMTPSPHAKKKLKTRNLLQKLQYTIRMGMADWNSRQILFILNTLIFKTLFCRITYEAHCKPTKTFHTTFYIEIEANCQVTYLMNILSRSV